MRRLVGGLLLLLFVNSAIAHHGLDGYNTTELVELEGRVIDFTLMGPLCALRPFNPRMPGVHLAAAQLEEISILGQLSIS